MNSENNANPPSGALRTTDWLGGISEGFLAIIWRRRRTVLVSVVLALTGAVVYLQRATPLYESTSRIYVEPSTPKVFRDSDEEITSRSGNYLYTQVEILKSTPILSDALTRGSLDQLPSLAAAGDRMAVLRRKLQTVVGRRNELISVSFLSPYPEEAAHIVNTVVDAYVTFHGQHKRSTSGELLQILTEEKTRRDQELEQRLQNMMEFKQASAELAFGTDQDSHLILRSIERLGAELIEAQLAAAECRVLYDATRRLVDDPVTLRQFAEARPTRNVSGATAAEISTLRLEFHRLQRRRADCLRQLKPDAPAIVALDSELAQLEQQIAELDRSFARGYLNVADQECQAAREREQELTKRFEEQRQQAILLNNQLAQYAILQSEYEQTRKLCGLLDDRIKELSVIEDTGALNITVLETAAPALEPSEPRPPKAMAMALGLGLFVGVSLALWRDWRDQRLRSAEEISALLGLPVLGTVPALSGLSGRAAARGPRAQAVPESREAEAFRTLRTAIFFGVSREEARTIVLTSPTPGEGKSTVVSNLAVVMAQAGQRVLLIDADFRRPVQHTIFQLDRRAGLSAVLAGQMSLEQAIQQTRTETLDVLTCGPEVSNPAEVLGGAGFTELVHRLAAEYDRVLIDSPPVTAVTDPLILAALCDVTILVLRAEVSVRRAALQARAGLAGVEARVLGVVVNDVPSKSNRYGYYGGYEYHSHAHDGNGRHNQRQKEELILTTEPQRAAVPVSPASRPPGKARVSRRNTDEPLVSFSSLWDRRIEKLGRRTGPIDAERRPQGP